MESTAYVIAIEAGGLLALVAVAAWALFVRFPRRARVMYARAARRVGGRLDPASETSRFPAVLADIDGYLIRAVPWPLDGEEPPASHPPFLELCVPVDGNLTPVRLIRRTARPTLIPLVARRRGEGWSESGSRTDIGDARWADDAFAAHETWVAIDLDRGRLRVLTSDPQIAGFGARSVASAIDGFAKALPEFAAAVPGLFRTVRPRSGPAIY